MQLHTMYLTLTRLLLLEGYFMCIHSPTTCGNRIPSTDGFCGVNSAPLVLRIESTYDKPLQLTVRVAAVTLPAFSSHLKNLDPGMAAQGANAVSLSGMDTDWLAVPMSSDMVGCPWLLEYILTNAHHYRNLVREAFNFVPFYTFRRP